ncbi:Six-hairpin glycosidase [Obba rivulosa]|uniref:Six-hairpin glycosidase n=1 Tax=Obba rivulosa TaxID=1052685 RepID=A0A8E2DH85_9APHY|nr:Six-hairpin glycosidase [Obba rivulosa]
MSWCSQLSALWLSLHVFTTFAAPISQPGFSVTTISLVRDNMLAIANQSWEIGTALEALTELEWPALSVFSTAAFPLPQNYGMLDNASDVTTIATRIVDAKPPNSLPLIPGDGAVGDPASVGVAVLLANWTRSNTSDLRYSEAAAQQLDYLLNVAPRTEDGAISQRDDEVQLWADFVYMAPPFIAYYGALQGGEEGASLLQIAYDQCRLYRNYLRDPDSGLWRHITLGSWQDTALWGTGNGWAAAGMLRVLETIQHSSQTSHFVGQRANLTSWIHEIISAAWQFQKPNGTLYNYLDESDSFADASSTALLASVTYRMAELTNDTSLIPAAEKALRLIESSVTPAGWLENMVDPYTFNTPMPPGGHSPEGQAFVLLLESAWQSYMHYEIEATLAAAEDTFTEIMN